MSNEKEKDSRTQMINSKKHIYQNEMSLKKATITKILGSLEQQKTNLMPLHDLKAMLELELIKQISSMQKSTRAGVESDVLSLATDPVEFYFGFFNLMNGHYATPPASSGANQKQSLVSANLLKLPKSPIHYVDIECVRELVQFMLQMDVAQFATGLSFLCKSLVEDVVVTATLPGRQGSPQLKPKNSASSTAVSTKDENNLKTRLASTIANQLLIQVIAMAFPDMFFGRNEKDSPDSPAKQVFSHYQKHLAAGKGVGNALLWICCQQSFALANGLRVVHPKCLELWFAYFYPLLTANNNNTWDKKSAMSFVDVVLDNLIKQPPSVQYDSMDLAVIPMPTFSSLFNSVFLQPQALTPTQVQALEKIYRKLKHLMFVTDRAKIVTSPPLQILTTLLSPLPHLTKSTASYQECVDLLGNLFSSLQLIPGSNTGARMSTEIVDAWVSCFADYSKETAVLVEYLIEKSRPASYWSGDSGFWIKIRSSGLSVGLLKMAARNKHLVRSFKKSQPHLVKLQTRLLLLSKLSRPPPSIKSVFFKTTLQILWLTLAAFLFYALVYVQCDKTSDRVCPLPFDPQTPIESLQSFPEAVSRTWVEQDVGRKFTEYYQALWTPFLHTTLETASKVWAMLPPAVALFIGDARVQVGEFWARSGLEMTFTLWLVRMEENAVHVGVKWTEFTTTVLPVVFEVVEKRWREAAVLFVDVYLPLAVVQLNILIEKGGELVGVSAGYFEKAADSAFVHQIKSHWVTVSALEQYKMHVEPVLVQVYAILGQYYQLIANYVTEFDWNALEAAIVKLVKK